MVDRAPHTGEMHEEWPAGVRDAAGAQSAVDLPEPLAQPVPSIDPHLDELIDEASRESFPASDAPANHFFD